MISLHFIDSQSQLAGEFPLDSLLPLLTSQGIDPTSLQQYTMDSLVDALQSVFERATPHDTTLPGVLVQKPEASLTDEEKAILKTQTVRHFSMQDQAYVEFTPPIIQAAPPAPDGYSDLNALLGILKNERNEGHSVQVIVQ